MVIHAQESPKRFLKFYLKNKWRYKVDLVLATSYLLKLQIDHVILDGHSQAYMKLIYSIYKISKTGGVKKIYIHTERYCKYRKIFNGKNLFISTLGPTQFMLI